MKERIICLLIGYLFGCFMTAEIVVRKLTGRPARELGTSGNPGMANVMANLGFKAGITVLIGDLMKTAAASVVSYLLFGEDIGKMALLYAGLGATLGHVFPAWHRFKGGKGVTTIASTIILVNPLLGWLAGVVGVAAIILSGYLSVAAVIAMAFYAVAMLFLGHPEVAFIAVVFQAITIRCHWSKLAGIKDGTTHRAGLSIRFWNLVRGKRD